MMPSVRFLAAHLKGDASLKGTNTLLLVSNHVVSTYSDDGDGDTLLYTGMGQKATRA